MSDIDVGVEMTAVARALNKVRSNGAAVIAARAAETHGKDLALKAEDLPDLFRGAAAGSVLKKQVSGDVYQVQAKRPSFEGVSVAAQPVNAGGWADLRRKIERVYIDGTAIYAAGDLDVSAFRALIGDLDQRLVEYGKVLEKEGVIGGAGKIIGDAAHAVGTGVKNVEKGTAAGVAEVGSGATSLIFGGLLAGWWPVLLVAGVAAGAYFLGPSLLAGKVLHR
jgi:hypothetical protein